MNSATLLSNLLASFEFLSYFVCFSTASAVIADSELAELSPGRHPLVETGKGKLTFQLI